MVTYANQKVITIKKPKANKENTYSVMNKEYLFDAIEELTHNELKVYLYLSSNQDGYTLALSPQEIADRLGASKGRIQVAVRGLVEKGYIESEFNNGEKNQFVFNGC